MAAASTRAGAASTSLTDDRIADMGGGPALHSNLVQVERLR